ncbi:MAG: cell division protein SepF [Oscillospiraceae bacterium]|nr:cell division protein SepF [Oscillospiraceae bacterium]
MSFWDNVKKFAQPYGDDDYDDYDEDDYMDDYEETPAPRRSRPAAAPVAPAAPAPEAAQPVFPGFNPAPAPAPAPAAAPVTSTPAYTAPTGFSGQVLNMHSNKQEVVLFRPTSFNDSSKAADNLRNRKAVVINLENVDKAMARRVVDFLSGCVYSMDGSVKKIAQSAYLFCPANMDVVGDLENLQAEVESYI